MARGKAMNRRRLLIIGAVMVTILFIGLIVAGSILFRPKVTQKLGVVPASPPASPSANPIEATPSNPASAAPLADNGDTQELDLVNREIAANPLLRTLPHDTIWWSLEYEGANDTGQYVLQATIKLIEGQ